MPSNKKVGNNKKSKVSSSEVKQESAPAPTQVTENVETSTVETSTPTVQATHLMNVDELRDHTQSRNKQFLDELTQLRNQVNLMINEFKRVVKDNDRLVNLSARSKKVKKVKTVNPNAKASGFTKPILISNELCSFLGKPTGTEMARTEVTRELNKYIKQHNLQNPKDGRQINPDSKLQKLLGLKKGEHLNYFTLQKQIKPLFPKKETSTSA